MVKFGPAGNSDSFYTDGYSSTLDTAKWVKNKGLDVFEYSLSRGLTITDDLCIKLGKVFKENNIEITVHAPYYINFANPDDSMIEKSIGYILGSLKKLKLMGGNRCIFHPGSCGKLSRQEAFDNLLKNIKKLIERVKEEGYDDMLLCPETMGKSQQLGTLEEIAKICNLDKMLIPTIDFGHINAFTQGSIKGEEDYDRIINYLIETIGYEKTKIMHIHFSKIEYGPKGELKHLTFEDDKFGPEFDGLANIIVKYKLSPIIICESKGTQAEDAIKMKKIYQNTMSQK